MKSSHHPNTACNKTKNSLYIKWRNKFHDKLFHPSVSETPLTLTISSYDVECCVGAWKKLFSISPVSVVHGCGKA